MARKSRKAGREMSCKERKAAGDYRACFYLRLSDKDVREGNSESIENQRNLLEEFVSGKPDIQWVSTFIDDGKTGTNFRRTGFEQMMEAAEKGLINCIIVKDLSRFGRNYLETGHYIEHVFPFLQIRFIAVTDEFDTLTASQSQQAYLVPLKNIMNENYARDISQKERSSKKMLRKRGCFLGAHAMYGYQKTEEKHTLVIDPDAAIHVKEIFDLCEQGYSDGAIAKYLNENQVACPSKYKYEKGILKHEKYANTAGWYPQTVAGILSSRIYIGDMVQGVRTCKEIRGKKEVVPKESWDIVPGTHEPIVSKEQFARVEAIRTERHRKYVRLFEYGNG